MLKLTCRNTNSNPLCSCSIETESIKDYFLLCHYNPYKWINDIDNSLPALNEDNLTKLLFYNNNLFDDNKNQSIVMCTVGFIRRVRSWQRFSEYLLWLVKLIPLKSDTHIPEDFCPIKLSPTLARKNTNICLLRVS